MAKQTSTDVTAGVFAFVRSKPTCNGIDVDAIADEHTFLAHGSRFPGFLSWLVKELEECVEAFRARGRECRQPN